MIARLLQFLVLVFIVRFVWRLLARSLMGPQASQGEGDRFEQARRQPLRGGQMVRDSVCGVYVLRERALEARRGGEVFYFCSEACRQAFRGSEVAVR